jgi:hypothetical protein
VSDFQGFNNEKFIELNKIYNRFTSKINEINAEKDVEFNEFRDRFELLEQ